MITPPGLFTCTWLVQVCVLNALCANGAELFHLEIGEEWHCELTHERLEQFKRWMLST